jgi:hypothetical protein
MTILKYGNSLITLNSISLSCPTKVEQEVDEVEDGGRASAIEEGISALVFAYAKGHSFLEGIAAIDYELLRTIKNLGHHRLLHALGTVFQLVQETALGCKIIRGRATKTSLFSLREFDLQSRHDLLRHLILQRENVL